MTDTIRRASRRGFLTAAAGLAGLLAAGRAPAFAEGTAPKKLIFAHINPPPESAAVAFDWMAKEAGKRSGGALEIEFYGSTLLTKELEIMNAVKAGNVAIGDPAGAAATMFPEMGVFLVPYLVRSYDQAYRLFNGKVGDGLDRQFQERYGVKVLCFFDFGYRHFWNSKRPIVEPRDLRGMKLRVQLAKVFADTVNGLGGNAVPMPWAEVTVINLGVWNELGKEHQTLLLDLSREAQAIIRRDTESVDNFQKAKELLEPKGMIVNEADVGAFRKLAEEKIWPAYQKQYAELWEEIVKTEA
jgi:TRAP-type C4-dicarboxylate transport system substrate-binding protein